MKELKIGFPSGSLQESTFDLFVRAGYRVRLTPRSYVPDIDDPQLAGLMFRAQEIAQYVARGVVDVGLTGRDWIPRKRGRGDRSRRADLQQEHGAAPALGHCRARGFAHPRR